MRVVFVHPLEQRFAQGDHRVVEAHVGLRRTCGNISGGLRAEKPGKESVPLGRMKSLITPHPVIVHQFRGRPQVGRYAAADGDAAQRLDRGHQAGELELRRQIERGQRAQQRLIVRSSGSGGGQINLAQFVQRERHRPRMRVFDQCQCHADGIQQLPLGDQIRRQRRVS